MDFLYLRAAVILLRDENMRSRQAVFILFVSTQFHSNFINWPSRPRVCIAAPYLLYTNRFYFVSVCMYRKIISNIILNLP